MNNCIDINMLFILFVKLSNMNKNLHFYLGLFLFKWKLFTNNTIV